MQSLIKFTICYLSSCTLIVLVVCVNEWESASDCPKANVSRGELWLKDTDGDNKCYKIGTKGPCGRNMIFLPHPTTTTTSFTESQNSRSITKYKQYGYCECFDAIVETEIELQHIKNFAIECIQDKRTQIYVPERKRCYPAFHQGPCQQPGRWLVLNATFHAVCAKNNCPLPKRSSASSEINVTTDTKSEFSSKFTFSLSKHGPCYDTFTQGYCPKGYVLRATRNHWLPRCTLSSTNKGVNRCTLKNNITKIDIPVSRCKPGSRRDYLTGCSTRINPR